MKHLLVVGEDALCVALGERLVAQVLPEWTVSRSIDKRGITRLVPDLPRYAEHAQHVQPVLCIADCDGQCAVHLIAKWSPIHAGERFLLRLAVSEAECWLLADAQAFSEGLAVPVNKVPRDPEALPDAKSTVLQLARRSQKRRIREELVSSADPAKPGAGYNVHLCDLVRTRWQALRAAQQSPSLGRAVRHLSSLLSST